MRRDEQRLVEARSCASRPASMFARVGERLEAVEHARRRVGHRRHPRGRRAPGSGSTSTIRRPPRVATSRSSTPLPGLLEQGERLGVRARRGRRRAAGPRTCARAARGGRPTRTGAAVDAQRLEAAVAAQQPLVGDGDARLVRGATRRRRWPGAWPASLARSRPRYRGRLVRLVEPAHNVELRADRHGHAHVVFAFPYRADIVDAVRAIPGRRFDWDAKEWWAPQADATAPYVKGVLERFPALSVAREVTAWLAEAVDGLGRPRRRRPARRPRRVRARDDRGRAARRARRVATERGGRLWMPFSAAAAEALLELRGARLDQRALRCATRLQVGQEPAPAHALARRERRRAALRARRQLGPGHGPGLPRAARRRGARPLAARRPLPRRAARALPAPLRRRRRAQRGARCSSACARSTTPRSATSARSRAHDGPPLPSRRALGGELRPFQRAGVATCCARGGRSSPTSRASARPSRRSPRSRRTAPTPPSSSAPRA